MLAANARRARVRLLLRETRRDAPSAEATSNGRTTRPCNVKNAPCTGAENAESENAFEQGVGLACAPPIVPSNDWRGDLVHVNVRIVPMIAYTGHVGGPDDGHDERMHARCARDM